MEAVYTIWWSLLHSKAATRARIKFWEMHRNKNKNKSKKKNKNNDNDNKSNNSNNLKDKTVRWLKNF